MTEKTLEVPSKRFKKYLVKSRLGVGGMSEVFLAEAIDSRGDQINVALKMMNVGTTEDQFADEADLMGMLQHPNLVRLLEFGTAFERPFLALEFLIGGDLAVMMETHRAQNHSIPLNQALNILIEILRALAYFHTASTKSGSPLGLIHSDVNPTNVYFSGAGEVKLGDFGVASSSHANIGPGEGVAAGKLSYLSPEQTRGETLTPASDLWAVGVMMHELIVGYHPFKKEGASDQEIMNVIRSPKLSMPEYVDKPLAAILTKALTPDLRNRYRSAGEFAGPLFAYALDRNLLPSKAQVQTWIETSLGLLT